MTSLIKFWSEQEVKQIWDQTSVGWVICPLGGAYRLISQVELDEVEWMDVALAACSPTVVWRVLDIGLHVRVSAVVFFNQHILTSSLHIVMYVHTSSTLSHMIHMVRKLHRS